jgi:hypothetical protein
MRPFIKVRLRAALVAEGGQNQSLVSIMKKNKHADRLLPRFDRGSKFNFAKRRARKVRVKSIIKTLGVSKATLYNYVSEGKPPTETKK